MVLLCVTAVLADDEWREVKIAQGPVRGRKHPTADLYAFYNIPYATAPTGINKFKVLQIINKISKCILIIIKICLPRWPSGPKRDCYARGLGFDSQVEQKVLLGFSMKFSVAARS